MNEPPPPQPDAIRPSALLAVLYTARGALALALMAVEFVLGAIAGSAAGGFLFPDFEARAVLRVATLGQVGPVVALSEVKAQAESQTLIREVLTAHARVLDRDLGRYQVTAEVDWTFDGSVVKLSAMGPDRELTLELAQGAVEAITAMSNLAYADAVLQEQERAAQSKLVSDAYLRAIAAQERSGPPTATAGINLKFARWAGEVASLRISAQRAMLLSRGTEIIDSPFVRERNRRAAVLSLIGAATGVLLSAALAIRTRFFRRW